MTRKSVKIFSGIAILAFAVLIFFDIEWTNAISYAVTIAALLEYAYDRWLWKVISKKKIPVLAGVYLAKCKSSYVGKPEYTSTVTIRQTRSSISILEVIDGGGICRSTCASISGPDEHNTWVLCYTYKSSPLRTETDDPHYGTVIIDITEENLTNGKLYGSYFTNRLEQTHGTVCLTKQSH